MYNLPPTDVRMADYALQKSLPLLLRCCSALHCTGPASTHASVKKVRMADGHAADGFFRSSQLPIRKLVRGPELEGFWTCVHVCERHHHAHAGGGRLCPAPEEVASNTSIHCYMMGLTARLSYEATLSLGSH
jgi:hypothetical protein